MRYWGLIFAFFGLATVTTSHALAADTLCHHLSAVHGKKTPPSKRLCASSVTALTKSYNRVWPGLKSCLEGVASTAQINGCFDVADAKVVGLTAQQLASRIPKLPTAKTWCGKLQKLLKKAQGITASQAEKLEHGCPQFYAWTQKRFGASHPLFLRCSISAQNLTAFDACQQRMVLRMWASGQ